MQRKRGELVPVAEVFSDLPGPVKALRKTPPPARRGFTQADQVNQLVEASEADPDLGFMDRTMALCPPLPAGGPGRILTGERNREGPLLTGGGGFEKKFHNPFPPLSLPILAPFQEQGQGQKESCAHEQRPNEELHPPSRMIVGAPHLSQ